jgi:hemoglobin/transferrin/lactoferrin receptor protein
LSAQFSENNLFNLNDKIELQNSNISASSNLSYYLGDKSFVSLSIYNAFRNPNIDDIGKVFSKIDGIVVVPNVSLRSEKIVSTELIYRLTNENNKIEFCVFSTNLKDAIAKREITINDIDSMLYDGEMMKMIANTNINSARMFGVNFNFYQKLSPKIDVNLTSSYVNGWSSDSLPLAHIPPLSIRGEVNFKNSKKSEITFYTKYNAWKKVINFDTNGIDNIEEATIDGTPSWYTLNLRYKKQLNKIRLSVSCENILDAHYKTFASGISASGRNFIVSLQTNF